MWNKKVLLGLFALTLVFSKAVLAGYSGFPMEAPEITGTFMEYREGATQDKHHFHGGIDMVSGTGYEFVQPVAGGTLYYRYDNATDTYRIWIDHPTEVGTPYDGLATRYVHLGSYPGHVYHGEGEPWPVQEDHIIGDIVAPGDDYDDHLHFEVRDGETDDNADYLNPLTHLPSIQDNSIDYVTADAPGDPGHGRS